MWIFNNWHSLDVSGLNRFWQKSWPEGFPFDIEIPATTIHETLTTTAHRYPENPAYHFQGKTLSFRDIDIISNQLANALMQLGVEKGDRVAFMLPIGYEMLKLRYMVCTGKQISGKWQSQGVLSQWGFCGDSQLPREKGKSQAFKVRPCYQVVMNSALRLRRNTSCYPSPSLGLVQEYMDIQKTVPARLPWPVCWPTSQPSTKWLPVVIARQMNASMSRRLLN